MTQTVKIKCTHCGADNNFSSADLVSGASIKDDAGNILVEHPPVEIDENTFVACETCRYPMCCGDGEIVQG